MIDLSGLKRVLNRLRRFGVTGGKAGDRALGRHVNDMSVLLGRQKYPPKMTNPPQQYQRTGLYGNSWTDKRLGFGRYLLTNTAPYSLWVGDRKKQAWMHKNPYRTKRNSKPWPIAVNVTKPYDDQLAKQIGFRIVDNYK